jgi:two-component system, chemotaxis family, sensor kinase Cph1
MNNQTIDFGAVDLTNCDREPIHAPGSIQPHGALLTLDPRDLHIVHAGGNTAKLLGASAPELLGSAAAKIFLPWQRQRLRYLLGSGRSLRRPVHAFEMAVADEVTDAIAHLSDGLLILELVPRQMPAAENALGLVQAMVRHVQRSDSLQALYQAIAMEVRDVTGFDRVMVYRFAPDGSGAVIAEARGSGIDSFLGLHFPTSDIPRQARLLYLVQLVGSGDSGFASRWEVSPVCNNRATIAQRSGSGSDRIESGASQIWQGGGLPSTICWSPCRPCLACLPSRSS